MMECDGTYYLVRILYDVEDIGTRWEIVSWRRTVGMSNESCLYGWCNVIGFGIKVREFLEWYPLNEVIDLAREHLTDSFQ